MLTKAPGIGSRRVWVKLDDRISDLRASANGIEKVARDFLSAEGGKFTALWRQIGEPSSTDLTAAITRAIREYDWSSWADVLRPALAGPLAEAFGRGATTMGEALDAAQTELTWDAAVPGASKWAGEHAADLVGMHLLPDGAVVEATREGYRLDDATRDRLQADLTRWVDEGQGWQDIAQMLPESYAFSDARAQTIARTESSRAYQAGSVATMRDAGIRQVEIADGTEDDECSARDGSVVDIDDEDAYDLAHPNCSVCCLAVIPEDIAPSEDEREQMPDSGHEPAEVEDMARTADGSNVPPDQSGE